MSETNPGGTATPGGEDGSCTTVCCPHPGTVTGVYVNDGTQWRVTYCTECATQLAGEFTPDTATPPAVLDALAAGIEKHVTLDAAREAIARWLQNDFLIVEPLEELRDAADALLSLPEVQALIGGQPSGVLVRALCEECGHAPTDHPDGWACRWGSGGWDPCSCQQLIGGQRNEREPGSDVTSGRSSSYERHNPGLDSVLTEVAVEMARQDTVPGIRTPIPPTRRDGIHLAAQWLRGVQAIDRGDSMSESSGHGQ